MNAVCGWESLSYLPDKLKSNKSDENTELGIAFLSP